MSDGHGGGASIFSALYEWERKNGGGGGKPKIQLPKSGGKLRLGGAKKGVRKFHPGHRLAGSRINNIVKVKFVANNKDAARHIIQHIDYIENRERDVNEPERKFYGRDGERSRDQVIDSIMKNRGSHAAMFKIILSPKQNELNHDQYTAEIMRRFEEKSGIVTDWSFVKHENTEYHHVHIVMPGRDMSGHSYRLEKEHLDLLRELANEYQYELQDLVYQREKQIEQEFGMTRDEANLLVEAARDRRDMKDLGVYRPELDKQVVEDLLRPTNWDNLHFRTQLEKQVLFDVAKDFKELQSELSEAMQAAHPQLYQGLIKQLQTQEINNQYFARLQDFHPAEYQRYIDDPTLDRQEAVERLKQAFPEWFDAIVEQLKEEKPVLFEGYEKPPAADRQIIGNLTKSNPELFPELSKQIQDNQKNLFAMAYLAHNNRELFERINGEQDVDKQRDMLAEAMREFPEAMKEVEERLTAQYPDIYSHGQKEPAQSEMIAELARSNPLLFPQATEELKRMEVNNALYERFCEDYPEDASRFEHDQNARAMIANLMRANRPDLLEQATNQVKERHPELFKYERTEPSQTEIIQALAKEMPALFPQAADKVRQAQGKEEAVLLLALTADIHELDKQPDDKDIEEAERETPTKDPDNADKHQDKEHELGETAKHAAEDADKFQIGHSFAGLTGLHHGAFIGEEIDLEEEAKELFQDQRDLAQQMQEVTDHAVEIDPKIFQIEDIAKSVEERIEEHEKEKEQDERG